MFLEELLDGRAHYRFPFACDRAACPKAANSARENGFFITCHSGCHCTASVNPGAERTVKPSIEAIGRARLDVEALTQLLHALRVQRVHHDAIDACQPAQQSARGQLDLVRRLVLDFERVALVLAVVEHARHFLHLLPQRTAVSDVQLLEPAADREERHARRDHTRDQRQRGRVPVRIVHRAGIARGPRISLRLDVRRAAGQQDAIHAVENRVEVHLVAERRNQHRHGVGRFCDSANVLLPHAMEGVRTEDPAIRGYADQWFALSHV